MQVKMKRMELVVMMEQIFFSIKKIILYGIVKYLIIVKWKQ